MSLNFYPSTRPHDYLFYGMQEVIPTGQFYLQSFDMVGRSSLPTPFTLETNTNATIRIWINNKLEKTYIPKGESATVKLYLYAPALNDIRVENGIDQPVNVRVTATYIATLMDAMAAELYAVASRTIDKYDDLFHSPWSAFIIEWLIPWKKEFPDVRSIRSMSLKMAANTLFGEWTTDGGVKDLVSAFTASTPVVQESKNPTLWQPELYQPYTSGDDLLSWNFDVWLPNLCLNRWHAFIQFINNVDFYDFRQLNEDVVIIQQRGTEFYQQHIFDNTGRGCSLQGLLDAMGCMDTLVLAGVMELVTQPSFCYWADPLDMMVEPPGIGGKFFDSGEEFDGEFGPFDNTYDIDPLTDYWVGVSTAKKFDLGGCLDSYTDSPLLYKDQECCHDGPDSKVFSTLRLDDTVTSTVTPHHPLYGGDSPGFLANPYFGILSV